MKIIRPLLIAVSFGSNAMAATMIQNVSYAFVPNDSVSFSFDKFNPAMGTLNHVSVSVVLNKTGGSYQIDNDTNKAGTINLTHSVVGSLTSNDVSLRKTGAGVQYVGQVGRITAYNTLFNQSIAATTGDPTNAFNATGLGDFVNFEPGNAAITDSGIIRAADQWDYVSDEVTTTFTLNFEALQALNATGLSGLQQAFTVSSVSGNITVAYDYTPVLSAVPEPASVLLGGLGLLLIFRRRR